MDGFCRSRSHLIEQNIFNLFSCSMCYQYLFPKNKNLHSSGQDLVASNSSIYPSDFRIPADVKNATSVSKICNALGGKEECVRWRDCCEAAIRCCTTQLSEPVLSNGTYCPRLWDGYGCFDDTPPGTRESVQCPSYIEHGTQGLAYKDCTMNGTWYIDPTTNKTWTDYTHCVPLQHPMLLVYIGVACNIVSLLLLIPSCAIFLAFRQLRTQHRIKLHICFFVSFILVSIVAILWDFLIHYNTLEVKNNSVMDQNTHWCKVLYTLLRYTQTSNYFWMFCEGFYLHRLIVHAFKVPRGLISYYIIGWGASWIPVIVYSILRATDDNLDQKCWVHAAGHFEWIIYLPNLFCLFMNVVFLINILRILLTQIQSHPNEPSNYRRALKATFVLIPLFGIQWAFVIHRPANTLWYEVVRVIIQYTQGAIVSLVFCIFNREVHTHLKCYLRETWPSTFGEDQVRFNSTVTGTQFSHISGKRDNHHNNHSCSYIPLSSVPKGETNNKNG